MSPTHPLTFKNFKGGDYRAKADGGSYRLHRLADDAWLVEVKPDGEPAWGVVGNASSQEQAHEVAERHYAKHTPAELKHEADQRRALARLAAAVAQRQGLQAQLDKVNETLDEAVGGAFELGVQAGPMLELTKRVGITTRNRLYQIRDGRR